MIRRAVKRRRRGLLPALLILVAVLLLFVPAGASGDSDGEVWVAPVEGMISPPVAGYLEKTIQEAEAAGAEAVIVTLDTPGGLDGSMRRIIHMEIEAEIPVVMYVYPQGSRAASAGVYMLMGADVAAMAPQTNLGSATPVSPSGDMSEEMKRKVINDAAAYIRTLANNHGRNADWAEKAVREAVSLTAEEALRQKVVDFVAEDVEGLTEQLAGFETVPKGLTLDTGGASLRTVEMGWQDRFLHIVVNPNIAFVLMLLGMYGLIFELQSPGLGAPGIIGVISLVLALYAFQVLPVSYAGLVLIVAAVGFFAAEVMIQSGGLLALGGTVALVLGGMLLFDAPESFLRVDWLTLGLAAAATLVFFFLVLGAVGKAFRRSPATGEQAMVGSVGVAKESLDPTGQVSVHGELWQAVAEDPPIGWGEEVEVLNVDGMKLRVRRHT